MENNDNKPAEFIAPKMYRLAYEGSKVETFRLYKAKGVKMAYYDVNLSFSKDKPNAK